MENQLTQPVVKAKFSIEASKLKYREILNELSSIVWTNDNISLNLLSDAQKLIKLLTDKKDELKRPYIDAGKMIQDEYNSLISPIDALLKQKQNEKKLIVNKIQEEADRARNESIRISNIKTNIVSFVGNVTEQITNAKTGNEISKIEMRIGSELARHSLYGEFLGELRIQVDELRPLIKQQKELIKKITTVSSEKEIAIQSNNDADALSLMAEKDALKQVIEENKIRIQERAFSTIENIDTVVGIPDIEVPKAKRTWWSWEVIDIDEVYKKQRNLVKIVPNNTEIDNVLTSLKDSGKTKDKREIIVNGIRFFENKSF